ncbi:tRNA lysidine(34) synthetase TilS [Acinetobacter haemolyticus]|uniref:tRNA lysidine(34) synthetase TilS n=2 Tax=Acinetobacter haemolyticus TaxID=29430 RepID=UPI0009B6D97A|nr:tRNA lysidine(34) synthetase TilS [Acinetobacter haemolyticus]NAR52597.1 tRNA lysidine(34) synthetase TilS [Acinetobacter haemolyticus]QHI23859.1 tRNA lysidine(34) synthetase TilS [Acinetobacter haemolyticus]
MRRTLSTFNEVWQQQFRHRVLTQAQHFTEKAQFLIGCSGGMDSMLLLYLMSEIFPKQIRAIYIDHQLQQMSAEWGILVQQQSEALNIPCIIQKVSVDAGNLEQQARHVRYQAYQQHLDGHEILVLAHHQQDQAETLLLRLFSGAGVNGLAAMQQIDNRKDFTIWRPFLDLSREQIEQWSNQLGFEYVIDPTNSDIHYDRAWCREELWGVLEKRFPKMQSAVARTSYLMQDAAEILDDVLKADYQQCVVDHQLDLEQLAQLSTARQRQLLSAWIKGDEQYRPSYEMVKRLQNEVIFSKPDAQASLHIHPYYYLRYQKRLYRLRHDELYAEKVSTIPNISPLCFFAGQSIQVAAGKFEIISQTVGLAPELLGRELKLLKRQGGEKIHLYGRVGHWPLKKAIQEAQILPWLRHTIQILVVDNVMLGVFSPKGFWLAQSEYVVQGGWQPSLISDCNDFSDQSFSYHE